MNIVGVAGPQTIEKVQSALGLRRPEGGEERVADLRAHAIASPVACSRIIDADPRRRGEAGPQNIARLLHELVRAPDEKTHQLPLRDVDANRAQLHQKARHRHLAFMILRQHEAAQGGPEMTAADAHRQGRQDLASVRRHPALAPIARDMRPHHQILHDEIFVALEARPFGHRRLDYAVLMDRATRRLWAAAPPLARLRGR